ncbi:hypothetical protein D9M71_737460 [compost metagenome]
MADTQAQQKPKPEYPIYGHQIISAETLWPDRPQCVGKFVAIGRCQEAIEPDVQGIRTSLLVKVDLEAGYIETLNSIYRIKS